MEKLLLFIVVIAFSCKNDVNLKANGKVINDNLQSNQIKYDFDFPDTLYTGNFIMVFSNMRVFWILLRQNLV